MFFFFFTVCNNDIWSHGTIFTVKQRRGVLQNPAQIFAKGGLKSIHFVM